MNTQGTQSLAGILGVGNMPSAASSNPNRPPLSSILSARPIPSPSPDRQSLSDIMSGKTPTPPPAQAVKSNISDYLKNFLNVPKNIMDEDYKNFQSGAGAVTHGASLISDNKNPVEKVAGVAEAGLGTVSSTLGSIFAPFTETNKAILPGEGFLPTVGRGMMTGAELAAISSVPTGGTASPLTIPVGAAVSGLISAGMYGLNKLKEVPAVASLLEQHPEIEHIVEGALGLAGTIYGSKKTDVMNTPVSEIPGNIAANTGATANAVAAPIATIADNTEKAITGGIDTAKAKLAEKNVNPQLESSATRLGDQGNNPEINRQGIGETKIEDPTATYDKYLAQEKAFKGDIKQDTALGKVGEEDLGPAFDKVVKMRRDAGATMGSELEKVGETPTDTGESVAKLQTDLQKSGLTLNEEDNTFSAGKTSKVTAQDQALLNDYYAKLHALGPNPSVAELDAFLSKTPQEIDVYKNQNNITGTTNGMRIIQNNLRSLRDDLVPTNDAGQAVNPELQPYLDARSQYAKLSDFLDEGVKFMGTKTQDGDYSKDASMLKSAVQSVLNGGKKDWLVELENLTGNPILDKTVLALQAMKDAGNFRGQSLLETLNEGKVPTDVGGIKGKLIDWTLGKVKGAVLGSPEEQTRTFLNNLKTNSRSGTQLPQPEEISPSVNTTTQPPNTQGLKVEGVISETSPQSLTKQVDDTQYYHGTSADNAESILKNGYDTSQHTPFSGYKAYGDVVNLASTPEDAQTMGGIGHMGDDQETSVIDAKVTPGLNYYNLPDGISSLEGIQLKRAAVRAEGNIPNALKNYLSKQGYDGVVTNVPEEGLIIFDPKNVIFSKK